MSDLHSDTLNLLLANAINKNETTAVRAQRIRNCAKAISKRTKDKAFKAACKSIRNTKDDLLVIYAVAKAEYNYFNGEGYEASS